MTTTAFTKMLGTEHPLQLAPLGGGLGTPELAAAVAGAGGMGMLAVQLMPAAVVERLLDQVRNAGPVGVSFLVPMLEDRDVVRVAASRAPLVELFHGDPDRELVDMIHRGGALASWQVGSSMEARAAEEAGCDLIVAQGYEAGGRLRGTTGLLPLLDEILSVVRIPVIAAGGLSSGRSIAAVLSAGASGARLGTRFLGAHECGAHPRYKDLIFTANSEDTVATDLFIGMWPGRSREARVLRSCIDAARAFDGETTGEVRIGDRVFQIPKFGAPGPNRDTTGAIEAMALYAGQGVSGVRKAQPAAEILRELFS